LSEGVNEKAKIVMAIMTVKTKSGEEKTLIAYESKKNIYRLHYIPKTVLETLLETLLGLSPKEAMLEALLHLSPSSGYVIKASSLEDSIKRWQKQHG